MHTDLGLDTAIVELNQKNLELKRFVYLASHDLQAPLRVIRGFIQQLNERLGPQNDPEVFRLLQQIGGGAERMSNLLKDLLDYALLGDGDWYFQPVSSAHSLSQARADLATEMRQCEADFKRGEMPWVEMDAGALRVLFRVLLSNAIRFRRGSHPCIEVASRRTQNGYLFSIKDDGIGIPERYHREVFRPFRRLHAWDEYAGQGLGLTMAHRILSRLGSAIWIESNPDFGITVFFEIPSPSKGAHE